MKCMRKPLSALFLLVTAAFAVRADKVDDYVKAAMAKQHIPTVSIAILNRLPRQLDVVE